ncbi:alpha/beta fold hydrolase [filamentous cyanobacterium LEGE 11480]|uniref:Alpha/beta fold hydrolase n=1 Tax=Romeriopsis navalis LEGE 11480 TaxID=2777977 RepID=A0A928VN66_9CYAN|nr:alpha/beta hydrolase [Romeriopsis navalis]MBE9029054.1 alpha/beta fold hydrolase [Romeriopsis navalis LEGE 11480]
MTHIIEEIDIKTPDNCHIRGQFYRAPNKYAEGPTCVCIHGLGVDLNVWQFLVPQIQARGISTLCLDLRGHGMSDSSNILKLNSQQMADDISYVCQRLQLSPNYLISYSFGGNVALQILHRFQQRFAIKMLYAVVPKWTFRPQKIAQSLLLLRQTLQFLIFLGQKTGFSCSRQAQRRDHQCYAGRPDLDMVRFVAEATSISWLAFAKMLILLRLKECIGDRQWGKFSRYPIQIVGASNDQLCDHQVWWDIHHTTGWPLHWIEMQHCSLMTEEKYADKLIRILEDTGFFA